MKNASYNRKTPSFFLKAKSRFFWFFSGLFSVFYNLTVVPFLYLFAPRVSAGSLYNSIRDLLWGFKIDDSKERIGILSFPPEKKWRILLSTALVVLLQAAKIVLFVYFCAYEAEFWSNLIGKQGIGFYLAGKWVVGIIILQEVLDFFCKRLRAHAISDIRETMTDMLMQQHEHIHPGKHRTWGQPAQIVQENIEKYALLGSNTFFNVTSAFMFAVYFTHVILQVNPMVLTYVAGIALGFKLLIEIGNWLSGDVWNVIDSKRASLRNTVQDTLLTGEVYARLGISKGKIGTRINNDNHEVSVATINYTFFDSLLNFIKWGLRKITEPLMTMLTAVLYFSGNVMWAKLNLLTNSAIRLVNELLDLNCDVVNYNNFKASHDRIHSIIKPKKELAEKKPHNAVEFKNGTVWSHPDQTIKTKFIITEHSSPAKGKVIKISGKNGVGKSSFFKEYQKTHENVHLLNTDTLKINFDILGDVAIQTIIEESKFAIPDDIRQELAKTYSPLSEGQKVWVLMAKYFYLMDKGEIKSPDCLLIDEIDAALDREGKPAFWEALDASEVENIYAITHSNEAHYTFNPAS